MTLRIAQGVVLMLMVGALGAPIATAQTAPETPPAPAPEKTEERAAPEPLPDLDELLGIEREEGATEEAPPEIDPEQFELERALDARTVSEMFQQAVQQMSDAAKLLIDGRNSGPATQRVQQEIITKLEKLIEEAEKQQSSSSSSSSSQSRQQQQQQSQPQQPRDSQNQGAQGENRGERTPPGAQTGPLSGEIDSLAAAWGALPARIREALLQGAGDKFSSLYESMTEAYYRKLAEQDKEPR